MRTSQKIPPHNHSTTNRFAMQPRRTPVSLEQNPNRHQEILVLHRSSSITSSATLKCRSPLSSLSSYTHWCRRAAIQPEHPLYHPDSEPPHR